MTGMEVELLAKVLVGALAALLAFSEHAHFFANSILVLIPALLIFVYPEEKPSDDALSVYFIAFGGLTCLDRMAEKIPAWYIVKMVLLLLLFIPPYAFYREILQAIKERVKAMKTSDNISEMSRSGSTLSKPSSVRSRPSGQPGGVSKDPPSTRTAIPLAPQAKQAPPAPPQNPPSARSASSTVTAVPFNRQQDPPSVRTAHSTQTPPQDHPSARPASSTLTAVPFAPARQQDPPSVRTAHSTQTPPQDPPSARSANSTVTAVPFNHQPEPHSVRTAHSTQTPPQDPPSVRTAHSTQTPPQDPPSARSASSTVTAVPFARQQDPPSVRTANSTQTPPQDRQDPHTPVDPLASPQQALMSSTDIHGGPGRYKRGQNPMEASSYPQLHSDSDGMTFAAISPGNNLNDMIFNPHDKLVFNAPFDYDNLTYHMKVTNNSYHRIAYAIKGNCVPRIMANPAFGILKPKEERLIAVSVQKFKWNEFDFNKDRIAFDYVVLADENKTEKFSLEIFQTSDTKRRKNIAIEYNF